MDLLDRHEIDSLLHRRDEPDSELPFEPVDQIDSSGPQKGASAIETATAPENVSPSTPVVLQSSERPAIDWQDMITETVISIGEENQNREESRALMWRATHSIMFQSEGSDVPRQQEPIFPDFQFKPQVHVAGLGVTIGSCFIGLPIVGIPVEERTVAIRLFVCAGDQGQALFSTIGSALLSQTETQVIRFRVAIPHI